MAKEAPAIIIGVAKRMKGKSPPKSEEKEDDGGDYDDVEMSAVHDLIGAIQGDDADTAADALKDFVNACIMRYMEGKKK